MLFEQNWKQQTDFSSMRNYIIQPAPEMLKRQGFVTKGAPYGNHCLLEAAF
jgi:hypothetical protein